MSMPPGWVNEFELSDVVLNPSNYRGGLGGINSSAGILFGLNNERGHIRAYNECPPLKSIVAKRAKCFNVGKIDVYNTNNDKIATGPAAAAFRAILKKPNPLQNQKQFFAQQNTYLDIFGYCPVFVVRPFGVPDALSAIWNIPPWLFDLTYTGNWLMQTNIGGIFAGYSLQWTGGAIPLQKENLRLLFDDGFGTDMDISLTIPDSRLRSQEYPISNIIGALKGRNTLIFNKGPMGILSNKAKDVTGHITLPEGEKQAVQQDFARYGIVGQEWQVIITEANLEYQTIGAVTKDLMLFEEIEDDVNSLCDAYGYYPELLARSKGVTFDNKEKAEKMLYTGTIIPESESRLEQFTSAIIGDNNLVYRASFLHVPALQTEALERAQARKEMDTACEKEFKNNLITFDMWLDALELPVRTDGNGGKFYHELIDAGWTFGNTTIGGGDNLPANGAATPAA